MKKTLSKVFVAISIFIITILVQNVSKAEEITSNYYNVDNDKNIISRIEPETTVEMFKARFGDVKIYKNKELNNELTTGFVGTGMYLEYEEKVYELSVVGDFDGDGKATQVELTNTIRYIVGLSGATLEGTQYISADLTGDGKVDQRDITKFIRYIVYGELDLGKQDTTAPDINLSLVKKTSCEIRVNAQAIDKESGMGENPEFVFYVKKSSQNDSEYREVQKGTNATLDLEKLEQNTCYDIKVVTQDKTGNKAEKEITVKTDKIPDGTEQGAIKFGETTWENNMASTTIETDTEYKIEYQVNGTNGKWIKGNKVTGLRDGDILYARLTDGTNSGTFIFKEIKAPEPEKPEIPNGAETGAIIFGKPQWNNGQATVIISTDTNYIIEYQVNGTNGNWIKASQAGANTTVTNLNHNDVIYARLTDGTDSGNYTTLTIIDNIEPEVTINTNSLGASEIKATVQSSDNEWGMPQPVEYTYSIKDDSGEYIAAYTGEDATYNFTNLSAGKTYTIKVEVKDKAGNKATKEITESTVEIPSGTSAGSIMFKNITWENGKAKVDIVTNQQDYYIEYQVNGINGNWTKADVKGAQIIVPNLNHNDIVYARLTDGTSSSGWATLDILDGIAPIMDISTSIATSKITIAVTTVDVESGMPSPITYKYSIKTGNETYREAYTGPNASYDFMGLIQGTTYTIKVETQDNAGNVATKETTVTTKSIPTAEGSITIGQPVWANGKANVTITTNTSFYIEYQINSITGTWTKATTEGTAVTLNNLNHNDIVYARLTDGSSSGGYICLTIADTIAPEEFNINVTDIKTNGFKISGSTTDKQSGLKNYTYVVEKGGVIVSEIKNTKAKTTTGSNNINRVSYNDNNSTNTSRSNNISTRRRKWTNSKNRKSKNGTNESRSKRKHKLSNNGNTNK